MKIFIFGGSGMAGHMLADYLRHRKYEVLYTVRNPGTDAEGIPLDVFDQSRVEKALEAFKPDAVINAVGLLNEDAAKRQREAIFINSYFPHLLAKYGQEFGFRLVHVSTDCVFSGELGDYIESDVPDGRTVYAVSKFLGEVKDEAHAVTVRTSIIGPELKETGIGLFHWFMRQKGEIHGYRQAYWSGVTTLELAKAVEWIVEHPISGLVHLTLPHKISKYELLQLMKKVFHRDEIIITPTDHYKCDKSLINTRSDFIYQPGSYEAMLRQLKEWMERGEREYSYGS